MQPESRLWALHVGAGVASPGARVRKAGSKVKFEKKKSALAPATLFPLSLCSGVLQPCLGAYANYGKTLAECFE